MKKNILIIACLSTAFVHGMETNPSDKEIEDYKKDLALCYKNILTAGLEKLNASDQKTKATIPLPMLDTKNSKPFPREPRHQAPIAIANIIEFSENNPNTYSSINK